MDINSMLPLIMGGGLKGEGDSKIPTELMQAMMSGKKPDAQSLISSLAPSSQASSLMSMMNMMNSNKKTDNKAVGFKPVSGFISNDIMGIMLKFFSKSDKT